MPTYEYGSKCDIHSYDSDFIYILSYLLSAWIKRKINLKKAITLVPLKRVKSRESFI